MISSSGRDGEPRATKRSTGTATLSDVASHAGVSAQTVSRSIRTPDRVSDAMLQRVREAIAATGYVPNLAASNLASNRSMTVAAIIPTISASVFADAVGGLDAVLSPHGYQLFMGATDYRMDREEEVVRAFLGRRPDGIFIVGTAHTPGTAEMLRSSRVPVVEAWNLTESPLDSLVGFSNADAIRAMVELVVRKGYRHPTFAGSLQPGDSRAVERRASFERAVPALLPGEAVRVVDSGAGVVSHDVGRQLLDESLRRHPETDVILFSSDVFAAGALLEANRRGLDVPGALGITGFGDFEIGHHLVPRLTTVAVPNREIGTRAGRLLLDRMTGATDEPSVVDLGYSIVVRESV